MKEDGIMVVVMPPTVLSRGASEGIIRQRIVEYNLLDTIIYLPQNLFYELRFRLAYSFLKMTIKIKVYFLLTPAPITIKANGKIN